LDDKCSGSFAGGERAYRGLGESCGGGMEGRRAPSRRLHPLPCGGVGREQTRYKFSFDYTREFAVRSVQCLKILKKIGQGGFRFFHRMNSTNFVETILIFI
jgi:hypothetical protein